MARPGVNSKRTPHNHELRRWASAVLRKATPKIVKSLIEAAESVDEPRPKSPTEPASHAPEEPQDESLAALLLRLLRTGENGGTENVAATAATVSENPSVG